MSNHSKKNDKNVRLHLNPDNIRNLIHKLPGYHKPLPSNTYVSYIHLPNTEKYIHYWFIECEHSPKTAPIFFWTNGGPGCSGLLGLFEEIGPFFVDKHLKLERNEWAWTKFANIVFIEQPVGVGFSHSLHKTDYTSNDDKAAKDNLQFLIEFFKVFPEFKNNKLYLTSESYGGHYIPMWSKELIKYNKEHNEFNFKGMILGNPFITYDTGEDAQIETFWGNQRMPIRLWEKFKKSNCRRTFKSRSICKKIEDEVSQAVGKVNPYAIDAPLCISHQGRKLHKFITNKTFNYYNQSKRDIACIDKFTKQYLNSPEVKEIIKPANDRIWTQCSNSVKYRLKDGYNSMVKYVKEILYDKDLKDFDILILSGTNDSICSTVGTQKWIHALNLKIVKNWKQYFLEEQPRGYVTTFVGEDKKYLNLVTVDFAGHEIPMYKPHVSYVMVEKLLHHKL